MRQGTASKTEAAGRVPGTGGCTEFTQTLSSGQPTQHTPAGPMRCLCQQQPLRQRRKPSPACAAAPHKDVLPPGHSFAFLLHPSRHSYSRMPRCNACSTANTEMLALAPNPYARCPMHRSLPGIVQVPHSRACGRRELTHSSASGPASPAAEAGDGSAGLAAGGHARPCGLAAPHGMEHSSCQRCSTRAAAQAGSRLIAQPTAAGPVCTGCCATTRPRSLLALRRGAAAVGCCSGASDHSAHKQPTSPAWTRGPCMWRPRWLPATRAVAPRAPARLPAGPAGRLTAPCGPGT